MCVVLPKHFYISSIPVRHYYICVPVQCVCVCFFGSHIKHGAAYICMSFSCSRNFMFCPAYVV